MLTSAIKRQHTQWGTQFLVAAELERRDYVVTFTMGHNTAVADLMVGCHTGDQFWVDVKGLRKKDSWNLTPKSDLGGKLFYILVLFQPDSASKDYFFVLEQNEANKLVEEYRKCHPKDQGKAPGFSFNAPKQFEAQWSKLPSAK